MSIVTVAHIRKLFGQKVAVSDVSFEVQAGEVFGLLGPNGAGKTTTIRLILNIFPLDGGRIEVLGGPLNKSTADRVGYMPEERGLYPDMRVLDCLVFLGRLKGLDKATAKQRALGYLERLEIGDQQRTKIGQLSRGMTQKVQVIAAILHQPDLLIIDEPFANLDPINAALVREVILELRDKGKAVIMTSHQMGLVEALCDRIGLINKGKVVLEGKVSEVRRQFASHVLRVSGQGHLEMGLGGVAHVQHLPSGEWDLFLTVETSTQAVLAQLIQQGFILDRFEVALPSLDEIFVRVVKESNSAVA
ncbi:MAG: ATP-binding cassette domain-containing protein [Chloroflexi bacterium]|nr:ATP-binding cassette domain-containing protein [Chloroflexota bacterium]